MNQSPEQIAQKALTHPSTGNDCMECEVCQRQVEEAITAERQIADSLRAENLALKDELKHTQPASEKDYAEAKARITQLEGAIANIIKICDRPRETGDVFVVRELASDALSKPSSSMEVIRKCVEWINKAHHLDGCCRRYAPYRVGENSTACDCGRKDLLAEVRREFNL